MIKIIYTNGDSQTINVTGDFFDVTLASKNGKQIKMSPIEKAEDLAFDLAVTRAFKDPDLLVSAVKLFYPDNPDPKVKTIRPLDTIDPVENLPPGPSFIKEMKRLKKYWSAKRQQTKWKWVF